MLYIQSRFVQVSEFCKAVTLTDKHLNAVLLSQLLCPFHMLQGPVYIKVKESD